MPRQAGRPMNAELDTALIDTAREMILERGLSALTVDALVKRVGTTRPAFYRRYRDLHELVIALLRDPFRRLIDKDTGSLDGDLAEFQAAQLTCLNDPLVRRTFPSFVAGIGVGDCLSRAAHQEFFLPRFRIIEAVLDRAAGRGEIRSQVDPALFYAVLTGPLLMRMLLSDGAVGEDVVAPSLAGATSLLERTGRRRSRRTRGQS